MGFWRISIGSDRKSSRPQAASRKFDRYGFDPEKYEGMPAIRLIDVDLT
jgi:hypothetical protein